MDFLTQPELNIALEGKNKEMSNKDWDKINRQAWGTVHLYLAKDQRHFVIRETKANELCKKLEDKYMTKSMGNHLYLKKNRFHFQCHAGISMYKHLNDYNKILVDLQNLEINIICGVKALLLLNSLSDNDHLIATLLYGKRESYCESIFYFFFYLVFYPIISYIMKYTCNDMF